MGGIHAPHMAPRPNVLILCGSERESLAHCRSLRSGAHTELSCAMQASLGNSGAYPASACFHPPKGGSRLRALRDPLTGTAVLSKHLFRRNASTAFHVQHRAELKRALWAIKRGGSGARKGVCKHSAADDCFEPDRMNEVNRKSRYFTIICRCGGRRMSWRC